MLNYVDSELVCKKMSDIFHSSKYDQHNAMENIACCFYKCVVNFIRLDIKLFTYFKPVNNDLFLTNSQESQIYVYTGLTIYFSNPNCFSKIKTIFST